MTQILLIDDDLLVRHALRLALELQGLKVTEAQDGKEGLALCDSQRFDVIVTDIFMPEVEGIEFINRMQSCCSDIPVIAISGGGGVDGLDYLESAEFLGAAAVFAKPVDERLLAAKIRELVAPQ